MSFESKEIELAEVELKPSEPVSNVTGNNMCNLLRLMLLKNYLLFRRQLCLTVFLLMSPLIICMMIVLWQYIVDSFTQFLTIDPPIRPVKIPHCTSPYETCVSIGYFIVGPTQGWIEKVMTRVAYTNQLKFGTDVKLISTADNPKEISSYLTANLNQTQIAVVFCTDKWSISDGFDVSIPCQFVEIEKRIIFYTIMYNYTLLYKSPYLSDIQMAYPKDAYATSLKISLDNAILREFSGSIRDEQEEYIYVTQQEYPTIPNRFISGIDVAGNYGAFYFFAPYLVLFLILINELLQEKGKKLRQGLTVMGLTHASYWLSWTLTAFILVMFLSVGILLFGHIFAFDLFLKTPIWILLTLFATFGSSIAIVAFFIATVCPDVKNGYTIAYGFILIALLMQMCFTQAGMSILFYRDDASWWVEMVRIILSLYPAFKYSLIYADISIKACRHYSLEEGRWIDGQDFTYNDLWQSNSGKVQLESLTSYSSPNPVENYLHLWIAMLFYVALIYYFDHVLESNRGKADSIFFCFTKPFQWCRNKIQIPQIDIHFKGNPNDTADQEKERVIKNMSSFADGLRIVGLSKTYYKYPFGIPSQGDVHALKDVYLEVNSGELLALLGHNGAGKTTLIGLLTGMFRPTRGSAQIQNYNINQDLDQIRSLLGVCPQFDVLWDQLTAGEHLRMYAAIKGVPQSQIETEVEQRLSDVELLHVKDRQICTFSGGMKRRVSIAISAIGNPKIIILDEPTTGMDPKARRQVWKMIKNMKNGRVVLLTTHAMEEADVLADRIAVMAEGTLKAIGTNLYLKNNYSDGYRINIVCDEVELCLSLMRQVLPDFKLLDTSGGSILISIPFSQSHNLESFFQVVEHRHQDDRMTQLSKLIKDWGLSHATLEEVFMKVTRQCE